MHFVGRTCGCRGRIGGGRDARSRFASAARASWPESRRLLSVTASLCPPCRASSPCLVLPRTRSGCLLRGTAPILPVDPHALWFGLLWCAWGDWLPAPGPPPRALVRGLATVPPPACRPPPIVAGVALACASLVAFGPVVLRALFLLGPHSVLVVLVAAAGEVPPATSCGWCSCALGSARAFRLVLLGFWRLLPRYPV